MFTKQTQPNKATGSFMEQLDAWTDANIIGVLLSNDDGPTETITEEDIDGVKRAIRQKVLESYRNGQQAGRPAERRSK